MSLTKENMNNVLAYLPYFQDEKEEKYQMSAVSMSGPYLYDERVVKFLRALYEEDMVIDFDWHGWGQEAIQYFTSKERIESADLETIQKLFTTIARAEKITSGVMAEMISKGVILDLLMRLSVLDKER